jgi:hypothetical protein
MDLIDGGEWEEKPLMDETEMGFMFDQIFETSVS